MRETTPGCSVLRGWRARVGRLVGVAFLPAEAVRVVAVDRLLAAAVRDTLRGDLAADVLAVFPRLEVLLDDARAELALRLLPFDLDRADAVRDEAEREAARGEAPAFFELLREEVPPPPAVVDLAAFFAVELFLVELLRPTVELFLDDAMLLDGLLPEDDLLPVDLLRDVAEPPFLPAGLFLAEVLFELLPEDLDEPELFFEPPLLLPDPDEREPDDFFVVAMLLPSKILFGIFLHQQRLAIFVPT